MFDKLRNDVADAIERAAEEFHWSRINSIDENEAVVVVAVIIDKVAEIIRA
jgi:hypothetical protein